MPQVGIAADKLSRYLTVAHAQRKRAHRKAIEDFGQDNPMVKTLAGDIAELELELMNLNQKKK